MGRKTNVKVLLVLVIFLLDSCGLLRLAMAKAPRADKAEEQQKKKAQLPAGASGNWWAAVQKEIRKLEYKITWQEETCLADLKSAYQAPNRAQDLRTYFVPKGIRIVQRTESAPNWQWGLCLKGYGYAGAAKAVDNAMLVVSGNRIEYRRGDVVEWYINDEKGLEQGFTLSGPPEADGKETKTEIVLEMAVSGELEGRMSKDGKMVTFATSEGKEVINYGALVAKDAAGRELVSRISLGEGHITLEIDAGGARYPLTIDPVITSTPATADWTAEANKNFAYFGHSVATAGDVNGDGFDDVIVGAPYYDNGQSYEGAVFVYHGSASGLSSIANWMADSNQKDSRFGVSVGTAGDINGDGYGDVIVGACLYDKGQIDEGAAFVYYGSETGLSSSPDWTAECDDSKADFGCSVATAGDVNGDGFSDVIVGAESYGYGGAVFVYHGSAAGLSDDPNWTAGGNPGGFGCSVSTAGDVNGDGFCDVIVGAAYYDISPYGQEGKVFVYHGSASGLSAEPDWTAQGDESWALFGYSVSTAGDVNGDGYSDVIVGSNHYEELLAHGEQVFVYYGSASGLSAGPDWTAGGNGADPSFGTSVSTAGDVNGDGFSDVIVGAFYYDVKGGAFVYHGSGLGLSAGPDWIAEGDQDIGRFGWSVSTAGDVNGDGHNDVIVGASWYESGEPFEGKAFVYHGSMFGLSVISDWMVEGEQAGANLGCSVATAGDVNGDGYSDVIVGAESYENSQYHEGMVCVYHGSAAGLSPDPNWMTESDHDYVQFGRSVATAGDVNGDGYADVIVGASHYDNEQYDEGKVFVYHGSAAGLSTSPNWTAESDEVQAYFGTSVSIAGDINGDGYSDVIVGAPYYDGNQYDEGKVFVYHGSAVGLSASPAWTAGSNQAYAHFGRSVATAGDVNGDGYDDVIVGSYLYDNGQDAEGAAFVWLGSSTGLGTNGTPSNADWTAEGNLIGALFASSVATAGDVNGDGYADVIVGGARKGFVYYGSSTGLSVSPDWTAECDESDARFGWSVSSAGDINGDGYSDVIVGAPYYDDNQYDEGKVFVYHGSATGLSASPVWTAKSGQAYARFGNSVGTADDINGDGLSDIVIGAAYYSNGQTFEGAAFVYYGRCWLKADLTGDCSVNYFDFAKLVQDWLQPSLVVDLTGNSYIDYFDLDVLALYWLGENNPPPGVASNPNPPDGASTADYNADLSWTASLFTESHDVYFGTSSPPPFIGNQSATTFDPGTMTIGAKYYWRVNEVGAYDTTLGTVWSLTIMTPPL